MAMIKVETKGNFDNLEGWLRKRRFEKIKNLLDKYGQEGVDALAAATPVDTGKTRDSWDYKVEITDKRIVLSWHNTNVAEGSRPIPIVFLIQYGHGTRNGGYVPPRDFINPAAIPVLEEVVRKVWKEVAKL